VINLFNYVDRQSPIHRLTGATKLVCMLLWSLASMVTYDTRLLIIMPLISLVFFRISKIKISDVRFMLTITIIFLVLNNVTIFLFTPEHGVSIYGTRNLLFTIAGRYTITKEQLFYHLNLLLKYLASIPMILLFLFTTNPSEFAASLNKIGVSYKISYSVALALRYIPDIQKEYHDISQAQQARGIEMSKKESLGKRLKAASAILIPLILSSLDKIDTIANAMELRGFGKEKTRTWYMGRDFSRFDILSMVFCAILLVIAILDNIFLGRFWNPFI